MPTLEMFRNRLTPMNKRLLSQGIESSSSYEDNIRNRCLPKSFGLREFRSQKSRN